MELSNTTITFKNLINKYNNAVYEPIEEDSDEEYLMMIGMYSAS